MLNAQFGSLVLTSPDENSNVGTTETILNSITLPPNFFRQSGDGARITAAFAYAANGNTKTVKLYFGSSSSTVNGRIAADNNNFVIIEALIINRGNNIQRSVSKLFAGISGFTINKINQYAEDIASPIRVRITGQSNIASGDITSRLLKVEYVPVNNIVLG